MLPELTLMQESSLLASMERIEARPFPPPDEGTAVIFTARPCRPLPTSPSSAAEPTVAEPEPLPEPALQKLNRLAGQELTIEPDPTPAEAGCREPAGALGAGARRGESNSIRAISCSVLSPSPNRRLPA